MRMRNSSFELCVGIRDIRVCGSCNEVLDTCLHYQYIPVDTRIRHHYHLNRVEWIHINFDLGIMRFCRGRMHTQEDVFLLNSGRHLLTP